MSLVEAVTGHAFPIQPAVCGLKHDDSESIMHMQGLRYWLSSFRWAFPYSCLLVLQELRLDHFGNQLCYPVASIAEIDNLAIDKWACYSSYIDGSVGTSFYY